MEDDDVYAALRGKWVDSQYKDEVLFTLETSVDSEGQPIINIRDRLRNGESQIYNTRIKIDPKGEPTNLTIFNNRLAKLTNFDTVASVVYTSKHDPKKRRRG